MPFHTKDEFVSDYTIIIGGKNFGCGSSREHAPIALDAAGIKCVVAEFYARIFYRNSVNGGYLIPFETGGPPVRPDLHRRRTEDRPRAPACCTNLTTGETWKLKPLGDVAPIIEAGGVFAYAKKVGMLSA